MGLKDIMAVIDEEAAADVAGAYALSLAATFGAHLTTTSVPFDPLRDVYAAGIPESHIRASHEKSRERTRAAAARMAGDAAAAGVMHESVDMDSLAMPMRTALAELGRHFDLTVTAQPERGAGEREPVIDSLLFDSGRPVLVVPYIHKQPLRLDRVIAAWDGSSVAARAFAGAMPLLLRAGRVQVVTVARGRRTGHDLPGFDIARHLARHGIDAELQVIPSDLDAAEMLLSHAASASADLLVMGGYGNMRLRDLIFGGTTRGIMDAMTLPVLMAH